MSALPVIVALAAASAPRTVDNVTLTPPPGFTFELGESDHATIKGGDATAWCVITVYKARKAGPDLAAEFRADWMDIIKTDPPPASKRKVGSNDALEGAAQGANAWTDLIEVSVGDRVTTVFVLTQDADA